MPFIRLADVNVHYPVRGVGVRDFEGERLRSAGRIRRVGRARYVVAALDQITLSIEQGERVGLVGGNGSGKSTLLRVMGGVYPPMGGTAAIRGDISTLFSFTIGLQPEASGRKNIVMRGLMAGRSRDEAERVAEEVGGFTGLGDYLDLPLRTYSQGMALRLAFAAATVFRPEILLLDEWIGVGDAAFREEAERRLRDQVANSGIVVLASHNKNVLRANCDRLIWLASGRLKMDGPVDEVLRAYHEAATERGKAGEVSA